MNDLSNYRKRTEYPDDGAVVVRMVHDADGRIYIIYDDQSYLVVRKVKP